MSSSGKAVVGKALVAAAILTAVAGTIWLGWLPVDAALRPTVALWLLAVAAIDGLLGLRFLGEP